MQPLDFDGMVRAKIESLGVAKATQFFVDPATGKPRTMGALNNWLRRKSRIPAWASQLVYDEEYRTGTPHPTASEDVPWDGENLCILVPVHRSINPRTFFCLFQLRNRYHGKVKLMTKPYTGVTEARNLLATRFMRETKAEWCLFVDDDMVIPVGSPGVMNGQFGAGVGTEYAKLDIIQRLTSHNLDIVGGLYSQVENPSTPSFPVYHKARVDPSECDYARHAPKNEVRDAGSYIGMGATLIHRRVFEAIERGFPEVVSTKPGIPNQYFTPMIKQNSVCGEDIAFCARAKQMGFSINVDLAVICGHEGMQITWPHKKRKLLT